MKTACYFTYFGPGRIGITVGSPRGVKAGYRLYRKLAPTWDMLPLDFVEFDKRYKDEILNPLDVPEVWQQLHELSEDSEPVLLCFERPPLTSDNWCHRRIVAKWFEEKLGVEVPEMDYPV